MRYQYLLRMLLVAALAIASALHGGAPPGDDYQALPGPSNLLPSLPDAVVDLRTKEGVDLVKGQWRYRDAKIKEVDFRGPGPDLGPTGKPNRTYDITPRPGTLDFDQSRWVAISHQLRT